MDRQREGKKYGKLYWTSKALCAARRRLLAASKGDINGFSAICELELLYDSDTRMKYTCCWLGRDMYYGVEPVCLN